MRALAWIGLLAVYLAVPRLACTRGRLVLEQPAVVSGDEPHYLLAVNSLLEDHDLALGPDYQRVARGGADAGVRFRRVDLDHHCCHQPLLHRTRGKDRGGHA